MVFLDNYRLLLPRALRVLFPGLVLSALLLSCYFNNSYEPVDVAEPVVVTLSDTLHADVLEVLVSGTGIDTAHYFTTWPTKNNTIYIPSGGERRLLITAFSEGIGIAAAEQVVVPTGGTITALTTQLEPLSDTIVPLQKLQTPSGITGFADTVAIHLSWNAAGTASSYRIYRAADTTTPMLLLSTVTTTVCTDTNVIFGATYYYALSAVNSQGESEHSLPYAITLGGSIVAPPSVPTGIKATALSESSIQLDWQSVASATGYCIFRSAAPSGIAVPVDTVTATHVADEWLTAATTFTDTSLTSGTEYFYTVSATSSTGESPQSTVVSVTTQRAVLSEFAVVNQNICTSCRKFSCNAACTYGAVSKVGTKAVIDPEKCTGCGACVSACPSGAISLIKR